MSENNETVCLRHVTCTRLPESNRPNSFMRQTFYHRRSNCFSASDNYRIAYRLTIFYRPLV